jgi:hypothetical protein
MQGLGFMYFEHQTLIRTLCAEQKGRENLISCSIALYPKILCKNNEWEIDERFVERRQAKNS